MYVIADVWNVEIYSHVVGSCTVPFVPFIFVLRKSSFKGSTYSNAIAETSSLTSSSMLVWREKLFAYTDSSECTVLIAHHWGWWWCLFQSLKAQGRWYKSHCQQSKGVLIGPADPALQGVPFLEASKFHLSYGQKNCRGYKESDLTTADGQKYYWGT